MTAAPAPAGVSLLTVDDPVLLKFASAVGSEGPVTVSGNRTRWDLGGALAEGTRILQAPAGMVAYSPEEMTAQVRAGTSVADFHAELAAKGQRSALPERGGTVGGAIAVGHNAVSSLGRGRIRTSVLQVRYISADGRVVSGGGPTVKNVTGFDIPRLMVGSLGTLGLLVEVIIRTNPIPAVSQWLRSDDADPFAVPDTVLKPSAILWDGSATWVQLEGHGVDVEAERNRLAAIGSFAETNAPPALHNHRWSLPPADLRAIDRDAAGAFVASIGTGSLWAEKPAPHRTVSPAVEVITNRMKAEFDPSGRLNPGRSVTAAQ